MDPTRPRWALADLTALDRGKVVCFEPVTKTIPSGASARGCQSQPAAVVWPIWCHTMSRPCALAHE